MKYRFWITILTILAVSLHCQAQFLKANGKYITDDSGREVILRGMGLGGWMIQEGYMMETSDFAGPQHEIKAKISDLVGPYQTEVFYQAWHKSHVTRGDIDSLASWGFNSVRLPMHYNLFTLPVEQEPLADSNTWLTEGFVLTDSLIGWCAANHMYVFLDLHGAPGGQGHDANISDYDDTRPSLWESEANKSKTVALWRKFAERYSGNPWVGGYDLINEPNWNFKTGENQNGCSESSNAPLRSLLVRITNAIREVDTRHIIIIEGNCWGNNYNGMMPPWDNNMVLSFHKYWSNNDQGSIQGIMNLRNNYNVPIWLGESGENSNQWFTDAVRLAEKNKIGWAWWPLKKISSVVNPLTIPEAPGYQVLLNYWKNGGSKPSGQFAIEALLQQAENARIENCIYRKDVIDAMFRQVYDTAAIPFNPNHVPGVVQAVDYDLGGDGVAYSDQDIADYHVTSGTYTSWNKGWAYRNDGVDIDKSYDTDSRSGGYYVGWTNDGEWMKFTVDVDSSAAYSAEIRYAVPAGTNSQILLLSNGAALAAPVTLPSTGGYNSWASVIIPDIVLYRGKQQLQVLFEKGGSNLEFMDFRVSKKISDVSFKPVAASTKGDTQAVSLSVNKLPDAPTVTQEGFSFTINGKAAGIKTFSYNSSEPFLFSFILEQTIYDSDEVRLSYSGNSIKATDGSILSSFNNLLVINNLPVNLAIPGKIEAEDFSANHGLQLENTTDTGGGQNIGYTNTGDYLDYRIRVRKTATYSVEVRSACLSDAGAIEMQQMDALGTVLNTVQVNIPVSGGWQTWTTVNSEMKMDEGIGTLRVRILNPEFNLNWYRFTEVIGDTATGEKLPVRIYPNPAHDKLNIRIPESAGLKKILFIHDAKGELLKEDELAAQEELFEADVTGLRSGFYMVELRIGDSFWRAKLIVI